MQLKKALVDFIVALHGNTTKPLGKKPAQFLSLTCGVCHQWYNLLPCSQHDLAITLNLSCSNFGKTFFYPVFKAPLQCFLS